MVPKRHGEDQSTALETFMLIIPSFFYTILSNLIVSTLHSKLQSCVTIQFLIEFFLIIVPIILTNTILAEYTTLLVISTTILLLFLTRRILISTKYYRKLQKVQKTRGFITNARSTINVMSVIAILAVDFFHIFPTRLSKNKHYGFSLMDVGVGLYVYANGIVDGLKPNLLRSLKATILLIILGATRFFLTVYFNYGVQVTEYGVHWNFFITLAMTKIIVTLFMICFQVKYLHIVGIVMVVINETLLQLGVAQFVTDDLIERENFISANREGIFSTMGYVNIYVLAVYFAYFIDFKKHKNRRQTLVTFFGTSLLCLILTVILEFYFGISRQLANAAYCFWVLFIGLFMTGLFYVGEIFQEDLERKLKHCVVSPIIFQAVNYNGLIFFLIGNVLTGLINLNVNTLFTDVVPSITIVSIYMLVNCGFMCVLYKYQLKLKVL